MDRNAPSGAILLIRAAVALLAEGVDRNCRIPAYQREPCVALLAEGVDRNDTDPQQYITGGQVALLAEGVDRNTSEAMSGTARARSPSSRRAWIEISMLVIRLLDKGGRPPRGGRG